MIGMLDLFLPFYLVISVYYVGLKEVFYVDKLLRHLEGSFAPEAKDFICNILSKE